MATSPTSPQSPLVQLHVCGSKRAGGAEMFFLRFIKEMHLREDAQPVPVVRAGSWLHGQLEKAGIESHTAPFGGRLDFKTKHVLKKLIQDVQPDIIQTWMNRASRFLPKKRNAFEGIPTFARLGGFYNLKYYRHCTHLIGNTEDIRQYLIQKGWPEDKSFFISNFTIEPPEDFGDAKLEIRDRFELTTKDFVILIAARLHENKGIDTAIYAMRSLPKQVKLLVVGDGPLEGALKSMVEADHLQNQVKFAGWANYISPYVAASDVWLVPSRHEPLGNTVLDAWAHKIPVAASDVSGPKSLIQPQAGRNQTGVIFEAENPESLARAVQNLLEQPELCEAMKKDGYTYYQNHHTPQVILEEYMQLYKTSLKGEK